MKHVQLGDVLSLERREVTIDPLTDYVAVGIRSFGKGIFHYPPTQGLGLSKTAFFAVAPGRLLVSNIQAWEGAIAVTSENELDCIASRRFLAYVPTDERIDVRFAAYLLLSARGMPLVQRASPGSVLRNRTLTIDRFEELVLPLPGLPEQVGIVDMLERASPKTAALSGLLGRNDRLLQSLPQALLSVLTTQASMTRVRLEEFADVIRGKGPVYEPASGHPVVNQACVRWEGLDLTRVRHTSPAWAARLEERHRLAPNDLLVNSTGEGTIGRACMVSGEAVGLPFDSHVMVIRTDPAVCDPRYLALVLRSAEGQRLLSLAKGATTTKQTELGKTRLEQVRVPIPSLDQQRRAVDRATALLDRAHELARRQREAAAKAAALWQSILNHAFAEMA